MRNAWWPAGCLLSLVLVAPAAPGQALHEPVPGVREFTGEMIARPRSFADWRRLGFSERRADREVAAARRALLAFEVREYVRQTDEYVLRVPDGSNENDVARRLLPTGRFRYVEPNWRVFPIGCPDDPDLTSQWHHDASRLDSCAGWDLHTGTADVVVGYCDTGIRVTHEDLLLNRQEAYNAVDRVWESAGGAIDPVHEHGTWVTGCGSGNGDNGIGIAGVGWNLGHRMLRVSNDPSGSASLSDLQHAARTSIENGDRVASVSYSGVDSSSNLSTASYVKSIGGLLVWAAGNDGRDLDFGDRDADDLIVAGGTNENDDLAGFSAFGRFVDVTAPATNVFTTGSSGDGDYDAVSGTSFATPLTAGLCALLFSFEPGLSPDDVEFLLKAGCEDLGAAGVDDTFGYGRIDVLGALTKLGLKFGFPNGLPGTLELTGGTQLEVDAIAAGANPVAGSGLLHLFHDGVWKSVAMADLQPGQYQAEFPGLPGVDCGQEVRFYVSVDGDDGNTYSSPYGAPVTFYAATADHVGSTETVLADLDFETAVGWTTADENLTGGSWARGVPVGGGDRGDPPTDFDGSGQCWLTENVDGNSDVDGGPTRLISPLYDVRGFHTVIASYARWFSNDDSDIDRLDVEVSSDGGSNWTLLESVGNTPGWETAALEIGSVVPFSDQFQIRFSATDNPNNSVTEAALDSFLLVGRTCPLLLDATPGNVTLGDHVDISTWKGLAGALMLTFVVDVNGVPTFLRIDVGTFDATGRHTLGVDVPNDPSLLNLDVTLLGFGFDPLGKVKATNQELLSIQ
jgi:hypothetical protein